LTIPDFGDMLMILQHIPLPTYKYTGVCRERNIR